MLPSFLLDLYCGKLVFAPFFAAVSFGVFIIAHLDLIKSLRPFLGPANWVTFCRLLGVFWLTGNFSIVSEYTIAGVAFMVILLDGLDGYLARRTNSATEFGAFFDMETDAFFCATMAFAIFSLHPQYYWLLFPGLLRYFYVVLVKSLKMNLKKEKGHRLGKYFAVFFFFALITPFFMEKEFCEPILLLSSAFIVFSFSYSFWHLLKG